MINIKGFYYPDEYKDYQGCKNCKYQPSPLEMCKWGKYRDRVEPICSRWEGVSDD